MKVSKWSAPDVRESFEGIKRDLDNGVVSYCFPIPNKNLALQTTGIVRGLGKVNVLRKSECPVFGRCEAQADNNQTMKKGESMRPRMRWARRHI